MLEQKSFWALIVDDDADMRSILSEQIAIDIPGARIVEALNGAEGLLKVSRQRFDLIITDMKMPRVDGNSFLQSLGTLDAKFKPRAVFVVSGFATPELLPKNLANLEFFGKPIEHEKLSKCLKAVVAGANSATAAAPGAAGECKNKLKIDVNFINPFIAATLEVVQTTGATSATKELIFIRNKDQISGDISAVVALNCEQFVGSLALSFELPCFLGIVSSMFGREVTALNPEVESGVGELCNQILGVAKRTLAANGFAIQKAVPSVISGPGHTIKHTATGPCISVRFRTPKGSFIVETVVQENLRRSEAA